jgi:hypothetical protein
METRIQAKEQGFMKIKVTIEGIVFGLKLYKETK